MANISLYVIIYIMQLCEQNVTSIDDNRSIEEKWDVLGQTRKPALPDLIGSGVNFHLMTNRNTESNVFLDILYVINYRELFRFQECRVLMNEIHVPVAHRSGCGSNSGTAPTDSQPTR